MWKQLALLAGLATLAACDSLLTGGARGDVEGDAGSGDLGPSPEGGSADLAAPGDGSRSDRGKEWDSRRPDGSRKVDGPRHDGRRPDGAVKADTRHDWRRPDGPRAEVDGPLSPDQGTTPPPSCTYFVEGGAGNDGTSKGDNSEAKPWKTIQHAAQVLSAGETVCVKNGTYKEKVTPAASGSAGKYITYAAYPGHAPVLDGTGVSIGGWGGLFEIQGRSYIRVSGLQVKNVDLGGDNAGIFVGASQFVTVEKCSTYNTSSSGIGIWNSSNILVDGNDIQKACNGGSQECITIADSQNYEVRHNTVHNGSGLTNGGEGIDSKGACANGKVHHNRVIDLGTKLGIYIDAWDKALHHIEVYGNTVSGCPNGVVVSAEMGGSVDSISIYNNVIYKSSGPSLMITDWDFSGQGEGQKSNISIVNNTVYGGSDIGIWMNSATAKNVVINNNIVSQNGWSELVVSGSAAQTSVSNNLIDGSTSTSGNAAVTGSPKFVNAAAGDFHLQAGSPAIDKGTAAGAPSVDLDGKSRPRGGGYDLGAYEL